MSFWNISVGAMIFSIVSSFNILSAKAEYCWMINCVGKVGYVFIPRYQRHYQENYPLNDVNYKVENPRLLFEKEGIPEVNAEVTTVEKTALLNERDIEDSYDSLFGYEYRRHGSIRLDNKLGTVKWKDPIIKTSGSYWMAKGTKLKIMGFKLRFPRDNTRYRALLFAIVRITKDG